MSLETIQCTSVLNATIKRYVAINKLLLLETSAYQSSTMTFNWLTGLYSPEEYFIERKITCQFPNYAYFSISHSRLRYNSVPVRYADQGSMPA